MNPDEQIEILNKSLNTLQKIKDQLNDPSLESNIADQYALVCKTISGLNQIKAVLGTELKESDSDSNHGETFIIDRISFESRRLNRAKVMEKFGVEDLSDCETVSTTVKLNVNYLDGSEDVID